MLLTLQFQKYSGKEGESQESDLAHLNQESGVTGSGDSGQHEACCESVQGGCNVVLRQAVMKALLASVHERGIMGLASWDAGQAGQASTLTGKTTQGPRLRASCSYLASATEVPAPRVLETNQTEARTGTGSGEWLAWGSA